MSCMNTSLSAEIAVISHGSTNVFSYQSMFQASIFISCLDIVNSTGFLPLKNTYVYSKAFNCSVLCWRCQVALPGAETCWFMLGRKPSFHSKQRGNEKMAGVEANLRGGQMCVWVCSAFLTWSSIDLKIFLFLYEVEVSFLVFSLVTETRKQPVHSSVPVNYGHHLQTPILQGYILLRNQVNCSAKNRATQNKTLQINF